MARTDRSFVCLACRLRFWPVRRCPKCQETKWLVDLEVDPGAAARPPPARESGAGPLAFFGVAAVLSAAGAAIFGSIGLAEVLMIPSVLALGGSALVRKPAPATTGWAILPGPVARANAARVTVAGTLRAARDVKPFRSPLRDRRCVAYRLVGEAGEMPIDDARARPFDLELENGELVRVEAATASVDLPMSHPEERKFVREGRAEFLSRRGVASPDLVRVTEETLEIGARVIVTGAVRENQIASGYRETRNSRTLFDAPGAPLLIRPASEITRANQDPHDASA